MTLLPLARPSITDAELEAQARALASGRLVLGPENAAFEARLQAASGRRHAVAVASGTAALHAALWALGLPPGGEVLVPAFTFPAPAHAAAALGLLPVPVDVDERTWNLSPDAAAAAIGPRTAAILVVDQFGVVADHERLEALARARGVPLVEDAACAIGAIDARGRRAGGFGAAACFSFHPRKVVTTGEGGAVVVDDPALAERVRRLRHHGQAAPGEFVEPGLNLRLSEPAAAVGCAQLDRLDALLDERRRLAARYLAALEAAGLGERLAPQRPPDGAGPSWQTFAVLLAEGLDRARVIAGLRAREIEAAPATCALHRIGSFAGRPGFDAARLPVADALHDRALALPLYNGMAESDVDRVVHALAELLLR